MLSPRGRSGLHPDGGLMLMIERQRKTTYVIIFEDAAAVAQTRSAQG